MKHHYTYNENKQIALSNIHADFIPHGARFVYISPYYERDSGQEYILAQVAPYAYCLINLTDGNRWKDPITDKNGERTRHGQYVRREILDEVEETSAGEYFTMRIPDGVTLEQYLSRDEQQSPAGNHT